MNIRMLKSTFSTLCLIIALDQASAQTSLQFTVNQQPLLIVDAGKDSTVIVGNTIRLGGNIVAAGGSGTYTYKWTPATGLDSPTIARPLATVNATITYSVEVSDGSSCNRSSQITLIANQITAVSDLENVFEITVSPNPTTGLLLIRSQKILVDKQIQLELFDPQGRMIKQITLSGGRKLNESIILSTSAKGIYILKLKSSKLTFTRKLSVL
jgi:hypothetical protein